MVRDPEFLKSCGSLVEALRRFPTLEALHGDRGWPELRHELDAVLSTVRRYDPPAAREPSANPDRIRAVHWNLEHGNAFERLACAFAEHRELADADLVMLNEVDLGMARSGNRDVACELASQLGRHAVWAPLFLETTLGRHDDTLSVRGARNQESLFGIAILSRWPIGSVCALPLPSPERYQFDREGMYGRHIALIAHIARPGAPFVAVALHLEVHRTRLDRARQMRAALHALRDEKRPVLLGGDFNSHTFDRGLPWSVTDGARVLLLSPGQALRKRLLFPDRGGKREMLFDELRAAGFKWDSLVDHAPTLRLRFDRVEEVRTLAKVARLPLERVLGWAEKRGQLRLDWFAMRGFTGGLGHTVHGLDGPGKASDHAPIVAEVW